jgi:hypothetical protein
MLRPDADGYGSTDGNEVVRSELDGGVGRYRQDKIGASKMVNVKWTMNPSQYEYWRAFYATGTKKGALPFLCDLVSEDGNGPVEHVCNFIPGSVTLPSQVGLNYVQQAQLEVKPLPRNEASDIGLILAYGSAGGDPDQWFLSIEYLANTIMPENIGA